MNFLNKKLIFLCNKRLLGLDIGGKKIGISLSDFNWKIASSFMFLQRTNFQKDIMALLTLIKKEQVGAVIVGLPKNMNGTEGPQAKKVRGFISKIQLPDFPIIFWDERLSTVAVTKVLLEAGLSRKKRSNVVDKMAATYILQGFLDFWKQQKKSY